MTIARVRELADEMAKAPTPVVCSFTREQMFDLISEIDHRARPAPAPAAPTELAAIADYITHRRACDRCTRGGANRCEPGQQMYAAACAALMDQARTLL